MGLLAVVGNLTKTNQIYDLIIPSLSKCQLYHGEEFIKKSDCLKMDNFFLCPMNVQLIILKLLVFLN